MLHTKTIYPATLTLLKELMTFSTIQEFNLAGGTSLALQLGHRISVDLDFFGASKAELDIIRQDIEASYDYQLQVASKNIMIGTIEGVKVDFVRYKYPLLDEIIHVDGIRLIGVKDIAAMKLAAITGRGKKRDFFDLYFIMQTYSMAEIIGFYFKKFNDANEFALYKSIIYFADADKDEMPNLLVNVSWETAKNTISKAFDDYLKTLQ